MSTIVADGVTDDTQALQDAINAAIAGSGVLQLPPGHILITKTITVAPQNGYLTIEGAGPRATQIVHDGGFGDAVSMQLVGNGLFADFGIVCRKKMTAGANLSVSGAFWSTFRDLDIREGFVNLKLGAVTGATFRGIRLATGYYLSAPLANSHNLWLAGNDANGVNNGITFQGLYCEGSTKDGSANLDSSVLIDNVDGAWFHGGHIYGGANVQVVLSSNPAVTAVLFNGVYVEHGPAFGMIFLNPANRMDGITLMGCHFNNHPYPLAVSGAAPSSCIIIGNRGLKAIPGLPSSIVFGNL